MVRTTEDTRAEPDWRPQPEAAAYVDRLVDGCCRRSPSLARLAAELRDRTGTRLIDWVDWIALPEGPEAESRLAAVGFSRRAGGVRMVWDHHQGMFQPIELHGKATTRLAIRVESVADFLGARRAEVAAPIEGPPLGRLRKARIASEQGTELWVVERHGFRGWDPPEDPPDRTRAASCHAEGFRRRRRHFDDTAAGFAHAAKLIRAAVDDLGAGWAADLFFAAEREYWTCRNRAAQVQKARQDALGLGWANHDHHTYRCGREHFAPLVALLEGLGMECRERFYAGREAGWGAQVLEQPEAAIVVFADVDLEAEEVAGDFAHGGLGPRDRCGTVGLWCKLHGEALLQAGMHHLECRFDFDAVTRQLRCEGVPTMKPFTDLPYLKQAFTQGERWPAAAARIDAALAAGAVTPDQAERFRTSGAIGSHLEILQRDQGYKGFNQAGINQIIRQTDPRGPAEAAAGPGGHAAGA